VRLVWKGKSGDLRRGVKASRGGKRRATGVEFFRILKGKALPAATRGGKGQSLVGLNAEKGEK